MVNLLVLEGVLLEPLRALVCIFGHGHDLSLVKRCFELSKVRFGRFIPFLIPDHINLLKLSLTMPFAVAV